MNDEVDRRIVEMQFNNKDFLNKIRATIEALNELDDAMEFKNSTEASDSMKAFAKVTSQSMDEVSDSVESVRASFSALQVIGMTVLSELTKAAMRTGVKIYNSLIGQIIAGGKARSMKIQKAKFMLEGLGINWDEIQEDINYGVQDTAYGLDAAANAASQLSASGVHVGDDMKTALRGISGVAAMTSRSYDEVAHVFTRVAGQGRVMAIDLNSIAAYGLNAAQSLADYFNKLYNTSEYTEARIREMVSRGQVDFHTFAEAMDDAFGTHAKEANKTFTGALENIQAALSRIGQKFADPVYQGMIPIFNGIREAINMANRALEPLYSQFSLFARVASGSLTKILKSEGFLRLIVVVAQNMYSYVRPIFGALNNLGIGRWGTVVEFITDLSHYLERFQIYGENAVRLQYIFEFIGESIKSIFIFIGYIRDAVSPLTNLVVSFLQKIFGRTNLFFRVLNSINPILRIIGYYISQFIKFGLEKILNGIISVIQRINWNSFINGLSVIFVNIVEISKVLFNLAVEYLPKIANLIGYAPRVINFVRGIANAVVVAATTVGTALGGVFNFIQSRYQGISEFFNRFRQNNESTAASVVQTVETMNNGINAATGSRVLGRQANILPTAASILMPIRQREDEYNELAVKYKAISGKLSEVQNETSKHMSNATNNVWFITEFVKYAMERIGVFSTSTINKVTEVFNNIYKGLVVAKDIIVKFFSLCTEALKDWWDGLNGIIKFLLINLPIIIGVLYIVFARILIIPTIITSVVKGIANRNSYERAMGISEVLKGAAIVILAISASIALLAIAIDRLSPEKIEIMTTIIGDFFRALTKFAIQMGVIIFAIELIKNIANIWSAFHGGLKIWIGREVVGAAVGIQLFLFGISAFILAITYSIKTISGILNNTTPGVIIGTLSLLGGVFVAVTAMMTFLMGIVARNNLMYTSTSEITGHIGGFAKFLGKGDAANVMRTSQTNNPLFGVFLMLLGIAGFIYVFAQTLKIMDSIGSSKRMWNYFLILLAAMGAVTAMVSIIMVAASNIFMLTAKKKIGIEKPNDDKTISSISGIILSIAGLFIGLAAAFKILDSLKNPDKIWEYMGVLLIIAGSMTILVGIIMVIQTFMMDAQKEMNVKAQQSNAIFGSISLIMFGLSSFVMAIAGALAIMSRIDSDKLNEGMMTILKIMGAMFGGIAVLMLLNGLMAFFTKNAKGTTTGFEDLARVMLSMSAFIVAVGFAIMLTKDVSIESVDTFTVLIVAIFAAVGIMMLLIGTSIKIMGGADPKGNLALVIGTIIAITVAIVAISISIYALRDVDTNTILTIIGMMSVLFIALGGMMILIGAAVAIMGRNALGILLAMSSIVLVLGALSIMMWAMSEIDVENVANGITVLKNLMIFVGILMIAMTVIGALIYATDGVAALILGIGLAIIAVVIGFLLMVADGLASIALKFTTALMNLHQIDYSFVPTFAIAIVTLCTALAKVASVPLSVQFSMMIVANSLLLITKAIKSMAGVDFSTLQDNVVTISTSMEWFSKQTNQNAGRYFLTAAIFLGLGIIFGLAATVLGYGFATLTIAILVGALALVSAGKLLATNASIIRTGLSELVNTINYIGEKIAETGWEFGANLLMLMAVGVALFGVGVTLLLGATMLSAASLVFLIGSLMLLGGFKLINMAFESVDLIALGETFKDFADTLAMGATFLLSPVIVFSVLAVVFAIGALVLYGGMALLNLSAIVFEDTVDRICDTFEDLDEFLEDYFHTDLFDTIASLEDFMLNGSFGLGSNFVQGLIDGIESGLNVLTTTVSSIWGIIRDTFTSEADIHSPSRVSAQWGNYIDQGLINGINDGQKDVRKTMTRLANGANESFQDALGIHSPSDEMDENARMMIEGLMRGAGATEEDIYEHWEYIGEHSVESFNEGVESVEPEAPIEEEDLTNANWYDGILNFFRNIGTNISNAFNLDEMREKFSGIRDIITGVLSGDIDISDLASMLTERMPDLFGDGGILAGTAFGDNLIGNIMSYRGQMEEAGRELRQAFIDSYGGNERLGSRLYNYARMYREYGNEQAYHAIEMDLAAHENSVYANVDEVIAAYDDTMNRYNQLIADDIINTTMDQTGGSDLGGGLSTSSAMASGAQDSMNRSVINSNNTTTTTNNYNYTQNNYSPEALDRIDIYRQTEVALGLFGAWDRQQ